MFRTLLASNTAPTPLARPALAAALLHLLIIIGAVQLTASAPLVSPPAVRDPIQLRLSRPDDVERPKGNSGPIPPLSVAPPIVPTLPALPKLELSFSPARPDLRRLIRRTPTHRSDEMAPAAASAGSVLSTKDVDELPEISGTLNPAYPEPLRRAGISGNVQLEYVILPSGRADSASVRVIASTDPAFTTSVIRSVLSASFKPARRSGNPVAVLVRQTIRFQNR